MNISLHPGAAHLNLLDSSSRWRGVWVSGNLAQRPSASPRLVSQWQDRATKRHRPLDASPIASCSSLVECGGAQDRKPLA